MNMAPAPQAFQGMQTNTSTIRWLVAITVVLSLVFGIAAASGEFVPIALTAGLIAGIALVAQPIALLWLALWWTFLIAGTLQYFGDVNRTDWPVYAVGAAFWLVAAIAPRKESSGPASTPTFPGFLIAFVAFYVISIINTFYQFDGILQFIVGLKNYLLFFGLTLALWAGTYSATTLRRVVLAIFAVGLIQVPVTLYQYIFVRSSRIAKGGMSLGDSLVEASDSVVGTLGGHMLGGGLGDVLALLVFILIGGVFCAWAAGRMRARLALPLTTALFIPVLLAEAKVIFIYLPIVTLVAWGGHLRRRPHIALVAVFLLPFAIGAGLLAYYHLHWSEQYSSIETAIERNFSYSFADSVGIERARLGDMTRKQAIEHWWRSHGLESPDELLFGHGLAQSKLHSTITLPRTVAQQGGLNLAKTGLSQLLWDTGIVGTALFLGALLSAALRCARTAKRRLQDDYTAIALRSTQAGILLVTASLAYQNSVLNVAQGAFLLFFLVGFAAYHIRSHGNTSQSSPITTT